MYSASNNKDTYSQNLKFAMNNKQGQSSICPFEHDYGIASLSKKNLTTFLSLPFYSVILMLLPEQPNDHV